jgi:uncharacterized membrane protein YphA (DoxX/SURF4 family)
VEIAYQASKALSISLFLYYGLSCLLSDAMVAEFERFGLSRFRRLVGSLEVLGAVGLLAGYLVPALVVVASGGLTLLMLLGLATRLRVRDPLPEALPALVLLLVNLYVLTCALDRRTS